MTSPTETDAVLQRCDTNDPTGSYGAGIRVERQLQRPASTRTCCQPIRVTEPLPWTAGIGCLTASRTSSTGLRHQPALHAAAGRNTVERAINKLKGHRAVATRYDKRDVVFRGTIDVASIRIWLRDPVP
jgi:hypothetical protein